MAAALAVLAAGGPMPGWGAASGIVGPAPLPGAGGSMSGWDAASGINGPAPLPGAGGSMFEWAGAGDIQEAAGDAAAGEVIRVDVSADARETGAAVVSMSYRLQVVPETRVVPFTLLLFAPAHVEEISAQVDGEVLQVRMPGAGAPRLEGEIELPAALGASGELSLDLGYRVEGAVREEGPGVRIVLPMLAVDWAPAEARPGVFQAEVALPGGMEAREIFPVTPTGGSTPGMARASLQVLPAVVQVRARPEGSVGLSLPGVLELLVLIVVIACGMAGLRFVRRAR